jgi:hypothetical protein
MAGLAQPRNQAIGRIDRPATRTVRHEPAGSALGWFPSGLVSRILIGLGLLLTAWQAWSHFMAEPPAPPRPVVSAEAIAGVQITLGQAALALRDFGKGGLLSDRFDFEQNVSKVRRSVESLESSATEAEERQALARAKSLLERLGEIEKEHIARVDVGGGTMAAQRLDEIASVRDAAAGALADYREAGARQAAAAEPDPVNRLLKGSAGAGAGLLSLVIGAITLWNRLFSV